MVNTFEDSLRISRFALFVNLFTKGVEGFFLIFFLSQITVFKLAHLPKQEPHHTHTHILQTVGEVFLELPAEEQFKNKLVQYITDTKTVPSPQKVYTLRVHFRKSKEKNITAQTHARTHAHCIESTLQTQACFSGFSLSLLHFPSRQRPLLGPSHHALELALQLGTFPVNIKREGKKKTLKFSVQHLE